MGTVLLSSVAPNSPNIFPLVRRKVASNQVLVRICILIRLLIQLHTFEAMGLEILVLLRVFRLLHVKPGLRLTPGLKNSWRICIIDNIGKVARFWGHGIEDIGSA